MPSFRCYIIFSLHLHEVTFIARKNGQKPNYNKFTFGMDLSDCDSQLPNDPRKACFTTQSNKI